jgi:hypothetical protein
MGGRGPTSHATQTALSSNGIVFARNREREREREKKIKDEKQITKEEEKREFLLEWWFGFLVFFLVVQLVSLSLSPLFDNRLSFVCRLILLFWFLE